MTYENLMKHYENAREYLNNADITTKEKAIKVIQRSKKMTSELDRITKIEIGRLDKNGQEFQKIFDKNLLTNKSFSELRQKIYEEYPLDKEICEAFIK